MHLNKLSIVGALDAQWLAENGVKSAGGGARGGSRNGPICPIAETE